MKGGQRLGAGGVAALLVLIIAAPAASGSAGQIPVQVTVGAPTGTQTCGTPVTVTATILDLSGHPVDNQSVAWTFGPGAVAGDRIVTTPTTTNSAGAASTTVIFACTASAFAGPGSLAASLGAAPLAEVLGNAAPGLGQAAPPATVLTRSVTIVAPAGSATGLVLVSVSATGLPNTGTVPLGSTSPLPYVLALLGVCVAGFFVGRHVLQSR
jgi:hypothetical protein